MLISLLENINKINEFMFAPIDKFINSFGMPDWASDAFADSIHILPFLFIIFVIIECIEFYFADKIDFYMQKSEKGGVFFGSLAAIIPQCGFSVMASSLYSRKIITRGCLIAVYLATSDETIPILLATPQKASLIAPILGIKLFVALFFGYLIDSFKTGRKDSALTVKDNSEISLSAAEEGCCKHDLETENKRELIIHPLIHTANVFGFILVITLILNYILFGFEFNSIEGGRYVQILITSAAGLIPNCAVSIGITLMLIKGTISFGAGIAGLLSNAGLGLLVLLKNNDFKDTLKIIAILLAISVLCGFAIEYII